MGTPDFAVATLKEIIAQEYNVVGVITAVDKPAGRGRKLRESAVKTYAKSKNLNILQPTNLKDPNFIKDLTTLEIDLAIVVAFRMLPKLIWEMPTYGTFNLHASLLPSYRGAAPINWAIINGEDKTGITTFFIDEKIDTGEIILQEEVPISPTETAGELHDTLMIKGAQLVLKTIASIANKTATVSAQPKGDAFKTAYKLNRDNTKIDWHNDIKTIYNLIRGLSPYPTAWCTLHDKGKSQAIKIYKAHAEMQEHDIMIGKLNVIDGTIKIAVAQGFIILDTLQLPGKKKMDYSSLLNGYTFDKAAKVS